METSNNNQYSQPRTNLLRDDGRLVKFMCRVLNVVSRFFPQQLSSKITAPSRTEVRLGRRNPVLLRSKLHTVTDQVMMVRDPRQLQAPLVAEVAGHANDTNKIFIVVFVCY